MSATTTQKRAGSDGDIDEKVGAPHTKGRITGHLEGDRQQPKYQAVAGKPLDADISVALILYLCVAYLKARLELATKDMRYSGVRDDHG